MQWDARAKAVYYRTYSRPKDESGTAFESWGETVHRAVVKHHTRLWAEAGGTPNTDEIGRLAELVEERKTLVSGRTLWLGGTEYSADRACSQFNCSFSVVDSVYSLVDACWLLLNGCGYGFIPQPGTLHGFIRPIPSIEFIESTRDKDTKGRPNNVEIRPTADNGYAWYIGIGDSAEAWAKAIGKLFNPPTSIVKKLTIDFREIRGPGKRLKGYGWICNGWQPLLKAIRKMVDILNNRSGDLLTEIDILDVVNHVGTILSSRRSAQIALLDYGHPRWKEFAEAKKEFWEHDNHHRQQSNNSLILWQKPPKAEIRKLMEMIWDNGGSEPGFINGDASRNRAPYFMGYNPCGEINLPKDGFCNLFTTNLSRFRGKTAELREVLYLAARANYRQTCVNLNDGVLSPTWNQTNQALRLCGMSLTGVAMCPWVTDYDIRQMYKATVAGAYSMAIELGLPLPKLITTIKPEGTSSKILQCTEGIHKPLGRYIFNSINFSVHDPLVGMLTDAGYRKIPHPNDPSACLICFPVDFSGCEFSKENGREVNRDSAVDQLNRYRRWNTLWTEHNSSNTISWDIEEIDEITDWLNTYWNDFVGVSWLRRADPTLTAADLGYAYLPQEVVTRETYEKYRNTLREVDWSDIHGIHEATDQECAGGVCPVK